MVEVRGLRKSYGRVEAVRGVDLSVRAGEVFALLGPNGAGKTTTVEILEGYRAATSGTVRVLGFDPRAGGRAFRSRIGLVLQECAIEPYLTVGEVLAQRARYYPHPLAVTDVLELVGLRERLRSRVKALSGGLQRRLDLALALIGDPELLFLDEPTTGFDPGARRAAWEIVAGLAGLGKTIFLTTHYMDEAQALAGRVAILAGGQVVADGPPASLAGRDRAASEIRFRVPPAQAAALPDLDAPGEVGQRVERASGEVVVTTPNPTAALHTLTTWALARGVELEALSVTRPTLEEVYLQLTDAGAGRPPTPNAPAMGSGP